MEEPTHGQRFNRAIADYFKGEQTQAMILTGWSLTALGLAAFLFSHPQDAWGQGVACPLFLLGLIQLIGSLVVLIRSANKARQLMVSIKDAPGNTLKDEIGRMERIVQNFGKYQMIEMLLFLLGFSLVIGGAFGGLGDFTLGTGIGLTIQAALILVFDLFASYRAGLYQRELNIFQKNLDL